MKKGLVKAGGTTPYKHIENIIML